MSQIDYLNALRLLATFAVVLLHTSSSYYSMNGVEGINNYILRLYHYCGTFAVPLFVMISGCLFLRAEKETTYALLFRKYVRRVALALLVFGLPMCIIEACMTHHGGWRSILNFITGNSWDHMWYLYMLICLYLMTPIVKPFVHQSSRRTFEIGLTVLFCLSVILPSVKSYGVSLNGYITLSVFPFYYLAGYYFYKMNNKYEMAFAVIMLIIYVFSQILRIYLGNDCPSYQDVSVFCGSSAIFLIFKNVNFKWKIADKMVPYCFAIYILHPVFINAAYKFLHVNPAELMSVGISIPLFAVIFFLLSFGSGWLLRLLPVFRKYVL